MNQDESTEIMRSIYSPEKQKIWDKEMSKAGKKFESDEMSFTEYMLFRSKLRKRLGFPA